MNKPLIDIPQEEQAIFKERSQSTIILSNRTVSLPMPLPNNFMKNSISTSKYNAITFLPKNLVEQFQKLANVYFLIIALLQSIPDISNSGGYPSILLPLIVVLVISGLKDLLEDHKRKKSDREENNRSTLIRQNSQWTSILWKNLKVGDLCKVKKDEIFPGDIIVLFTSDENGICYIETKNLDGETNLKHKIADKNTQKFFVEENRIDGFQGKIQCEDPNPMIYQFQGIFNSEIGAVPLTAEQFLLRGSSLKNTDWIVGVVVYTGHESKIMLNSSRSKAKLSSNEQQMNNQIIYLFFLQLGLCFFCAVVNASWLLSNEDSATYLELKRSNMNVFYLFVVNFFSWMLLFSNFVPISLLVTLEVVKFLQAIFISWDLDLYYEETDMPAGVQSSNLNGELGQVHYLFSDKTGTLTCNIMEFRRMTIKGQSFGSDTKQDTVTKIQYVDFNDSNFDPKDSQYADFLLHLACCHTIIAEKKNNSIEYKASSPDELALVNAAKFFGFEFLGRDSQQNMVLKIHNKQIIVELLNIIEFNSDRKRMTVIIRLPNNQIKVLCKGADSVLKPRLVPDNSVSPTFEDLEKYGRMGLRTLLITSKDLSSSEYDDWNTKFVNAMNDIHNREKLIAECGEAIEQNLNLLGATAIEDRLQDKVPETIKFLREAGIKVWVLTGDKIETAVNIGFSCNLLTYNMHQLYLTGIRTRQVEQQLDNIFEILKKVNNREAGLIISGESLLKIKENLKKKFVNVCEMCKVVLACRVSPQQKADIVKLVRDYKPEVKTLSIGDGANDVNMINAAHVGVGIAGLEGKQAVRASDYSIAQFSFLKKLLFVHGRECYRRNSTLICYNFYKNVLLVIPLFYYGIFSAFSGQIFYNAWIYQLFNMFFASLPIMYYAIMDRELPNEALLLDPIHYELGFKGLLFSSSKFWEWILEACLQGLLILLISVFALCYTTGSKHDGQIDPMSVATVLVYGMVVIFVNIKVFLFSYSHTIYSILIQLLSILSYFFISFIITDWFPISAVFDNFDSHGATSMMFSNPNTYIVTVLLIYLGFFLQPLGRFFFKVYKKLKNKKVNVEDVGEMSVNRIEDKRMWDKERDDDDECNCKVYLDTGFAFSGDAGDAPQITNEVEQNVIRRWSEQNS